MARNEGNERTAIGRLRAFGLRYPGAHTKSPWPGHLDLAVKDKTFAYLSVDGDPPKISCKLPFSADAALSLPFTEPTPYGLGKSGWVTATFSDDGEVPVELFEQWIDESYRAQAPKRLSAGLPEGGPGGPSTAAVTATATPKASRARAPSARSTAERARPAPSPRTRAATAPRGGRATKKVTAAAKKATGATRKATGASKKAPRRARARD
jgi:predicted DNA-binding protein (MmcQ/YjbR family)